MSSEISAAAMAAPAAAAPTAMTSMTVRQCYSWHYHVYKWLWSAAAASAVAELDSAQEAYSQLHNFNIERYWSVRF